MGSNVNYNERNNDAQLVISIKKIEREIQNLYSALEEISVNSNPNLKKQKKILANIEELQQIKASLYKNLSYSYAATQSRLVESRNVLVDETAVTGVINNELASTSNELHSIQDERYNKTRMAEINNYYSSKYEAQSEVVKTIVYFCIPILILGILMKKSIISQNIALSIIGVLGGIGIFIVFFQVIDIMRRDNMVFDEYDFAFNPDDTIVSSTSNDADQPSAANWTLSCEGESCCPQGNTYGTVWDSVNKQCVTPTYMSTQTEGFVGEKCLQSSFNKPDTTINVFTKNDKVKAYDNINDSYTNI